MFLEILVEGGADVPTIREVLQRRFILEVQRIDGFNGLIF
jgi:hypothetical protein